jgi:hypothetical protein
MRHAAHHPGHGFDPRLRRTGVPDIPERPAQPVLQIDRNEIAPKRLETAWRRDRLPREPDPKRMADASPDPVSAQPHESGSSMRAMKRGDSISHTVRVTLDLSLRPDVERQSWSVS